MKSEAFISELHDIGKLVDKEALKPALEKMGLKISGHAFYDFDFSKIGISQPSSPSWYLQYAEKDDLKRPDKDVLNSTEAVQFIPDPQIRANVLLTKIADGISASLTRQIHKGQVGEGVYKLWNPDYYQEKRKYWAAFIDTPSLMEMFKYIDYCHTYQNFFEDFKENLDLTPEDKNAPGNIVSLYTHLELAGKIFRVLKRHSQLQLQNSEYILVYNNQPIRSIREACGHRDLDKDKGKWIFRIIFCHVKFPQSFARLQDLNILKMREKQMRAFSDDEETKDYILFFTDDYMCLFIPKNEELSICELLKSFTAKGLIIEYTEMEAELNLLTSSCERAYREFHVLPQTNRHLKVYEKRLSCQLPPEMRPNICDSCQIREGKERTKEQIRECLCDVCNEIRSMGEPAEEYAKWEGKAAWMKITLDQDRLKEMLRELFEEYIDTSTMLNNVASDDKAELKNSFRPLAVQMDFVKDYKTLLLDFKEKIYAMKDETGTSALKETFLYPIEGYNEFGIFKVNSGRDILSVISTFVDCIDKIFPKCVNVETSPIKLAISIAPVKYPYQEHWRFLSEPEGTIDIKSPSGRLTVNTLQYQVLMNKIGKANISMSHFLHRLTEIKASTDSDIMVGLEIYERNNRGKFPVISELLEQGLTPEQILSFYNLAQEEKT